MRSTRSAGRVQLILPENPIQTEENVVQPKKRYFHREKDDEEVKAQKKRKRQNLEKQKQEKQRKQRQRLQKRQKEKEERRQKRKEQKMSQQKKSEVKTPKQKYQLPLELLDKIDRLKTKKLEQQKNQNDTLSQNYDRYLAVSKSLSNSNGNANSNTNDNTSNPSSQTQSKFNELTKINSTTTTDNSSLVDLYYPKLKQVKVYVDHKNFSFSTTFNQSNILNNINKFYVMQVLQSLKNADQFYFFTRWGRVGMEGNKAQTGPMSCQEAINAYRGKLQQKIEKGYKKLQTITQNTRRNYYFPKINKKHTLQIQSKLQPRIQNLIRLIFDMKMINSQLKQIGYDCKKMPLGKLAKNSIMKGYQSLRQLLQEIRGKGRKQNLNQWSSKFYSHIPHDFGMKNISNYIIDNEKKAKQKLQLLQSLQDMQIFSKMIDEANQNPDMNPIDSNYSKLSYQITYLQKDHPHHLAIMKYVDNTHAPTHNYKLEVQGIYCLHPKQQNKAALNYQNKQLLWHGSRLTNYVGILNKGLRIAPPQAPATGYMFGKGVYFADVVTKSANYCYANKVSNVGCLILCQVALGKCNEKFYSDYYANLMPQEFQSTKGVGKSAPKDGQYIQQAYMPNGPLIPTGISNTSLQYNEYVIYNTNQIKCKYLLRVKFIYK